MGLGEELYGKQRKGLNEDLYGTQQDAIDAGRRRLEQAKLAAKDGSGQAPQPEIATAVNNPRTYTLGEVPGNFLRNIPQSYATFLRDNYEALTNPQMIAKNLKNMAAGGLQKIRELSPESSRGTALPMDTTAFDSATQLYSDRFGGYENLKRTFAEDPIGAMADVASVATGSGVALRGVGLGRAANVLSNVGGAVDPLSFAARGAMLPLRPIPNVLGFTSGAGATAIREAFNAGRRGLEYGEAFIRQMRGLNPVNDVVVNARNALNTIRQERSAAYGQGMGDLRANQAVLPFDRIDDAVMNLRDRGRFHGLEKNPAAAGMWDDINAKVAEWRSQDPAVFHTIEGLDALKQAIGNIRDGAVPNSPAAGVGDAVYRTIRQQIVDADPDYARVMNEYEMASEQLRELQQTLSLNPNASTDTAVRKLQSILRNNVNANYGRRAELGTLLEQAGATTLMPALAGQALMPNTPRGLPGIGSALTIFGGGLTDPISLSALAATSPRLVGEATYAAGRAAALADVLRRYSQQIHVDPRAAANTAYQLQQMLKATDAQEDADEKPTNPPRNAFKGTLK